MEDLIAVFNMDQLSVETRIRVLKKLCTAINYKYAANVCEPITIELILILDPSKETELRQDDFFKYYFD